MIVNEKKLKALRAQKNWTQKQLATHCNLSLRTIQRVEKDGVASNDTIAAYSAVFSVCHQELILSQENLIAEQKNQDRSIAVKYALIGFLFGALSVTVSILLT